MDERAAMIAPGILPGNMGGENLRQYCGLSRRRNVRLRKAEARAGISAQRLVIAIRRHQERAGGGEG